MHIHKYIYYLTLNIKTFFAHKYYISLASVGFGYCNNAKLNLSERKIDNFII